MLRIAIAAVLAALSTVAARAEDPLPQAAPEAVGMSSERLQRLEGQLCGPRLNAGACPEPSLRLPGAASWCASRRMAAAIPASTSAHATRWHLCYCIDDEAPRRRGHFDAARRGELSLNDPVERHLAELRGRTT